MVINMNVSRKCSIFCAFFILSNLLQTAQSFSSAKILSRHAHQHAPSTVLSSESAASSSTENQSVRFLGMGANAIIRPGVVLVAPPDEFHHFYRQSSIFIYAMGEVEEYENTYVIRGVIIDHPTAFTLEEMAEESLLKGGIESNPLAQNLIYRGGDKGKDSVFMLHNQESFGKGGGMIGTSGVFQGGLGEALEACNSGTATADDFKFYFNYCEFTEVELESMLEDEPWISAEIPSSMVLSCEWDRGDCWRQLRNNMRDHILEQEE